MRLSVSRYFDDPSHEYASVIDDPAQLAIGHSHDFYELFLVSGGTASHEVNGATLPLSRGSVVFIRPRDDHRYARMSPSFRIINVVVPSPTMDALLDYLGESFEPARLLDPELPPSALLSTGAFKAAVAELEKLVFSERILKRKSESLFRTALLGLVVACFPVLRAGGRTEMPDWLRTLAVEMVKKENFVEGFPAMRRLSGKSEEHLSRCCRKYLRTTPTGFVNELRLEFAARALLASEAKVIEVSEDAGFESLSHFYHQFKRKYGIAPNEYRRGVRDGAAAEAEAEPGTGVVDSSLRRGLPLWGRR